MFGWLLRHVRAILREAGNFFLFKYLLIHYKTIEEKQQHYRQPSVSFQTGGEWEW